MNKEFVPYQEALELKELGFDEPCFAFYDEEGDDEVYEYANCNNNVTGGKVCYNDDFQSVTNSQLDKYGAFCSKDEEDEESFSRWTSPLYQQAFRWFDENTELKGFIVPSIKEEHFDWLIRIDWEEEIECEEAYSSRPEAELACLRKLIEIVKQNG